MLTAEQPPKKLFEQLRDLLQIMASAQISNRGLLGKTQTQGKSATEDYRLGIVSGLCQEA
jgi:hypothetical protein